MKISVIQYIRPNGGTQESSVDDMPDELVPILKELSKCGLRLAAEVLTTGEVSFTIEYPKEAADFDIEIAVNGPGENGTKASLEKLIRRFGKKSFMVWKKHLRQSDDGLGVGWGT